MSTCTFKQRLGEAISLPLGGVGSGHWGHTGRPGERGGSLPGQLGVLQPTLPGMFGKPALPENRLKHALLVADVRLHNRLMDGDPDEYCFAFDAEGNQVFEKEGRGAEIAFSNSEMETLKNASFTHCHPLGGDLPTSDPRYVGNSFSIEDIVFAAKVDLAEMRAVSRGFVHVMKRPPFGWPPWQTVLREAEQASDLVYQMLMVQLSLAEVSAEEASINHQHTLWKNMATTLDWDYERVLYDDFLDRHSETPE